jgi:hypothetical protein
VHVPINEFFAKKVSRQNLCFHPSEQKIAHFLAMRKLALVFFFWCSVVAQEKIKREIDDQTPITLRQVFRKAFVFTVELV